MADPNPFDQFDSSTPAPAASNPFDQFDAPAVTHTFKARSPDGKEVTFQASADASDADLKAASLKALGINKPTNVDVYRDGRSGPDTRPKSFFQGIKEGVEQPINRASEWVEGGLDKVGGVFGNPNLGHDLNNLGAHVGLPGSVDQAEQNQQRIAAASPTQGSGLGRFVGNVAATAAIPGGALAQGAIGGALLTPGKTVGDQLVGAAEGAAGGVLGGAALRGAAHLAAPVVSPALRTLMDAGIRVTPGQIGRSLGTRTGNAIGNIEDKAMSLPIAGNAIRGAREAAQQDFGAAAVGRALEPIGEALPAAAQGRGAVRFAGDRLSAAYNDVAPRLTATGDQQFISDLAQVHAEAANMVGPRQQQYQNILQGLGRFWNNGQTITGDGFKAIETRLGQRIRDSRMSPDADQRELGQRLADVQQAVRDLAARQNPAEAARISDINRGWASLAQVEKAAGNASGDITPAGYSQSVKASSATVRRRGYARGQALNQDLSDAASSILPARLANSGTADRIGLLALGGLGVRAVSGDPYAIGGLGAVGAGSLAYSPPVQSLIRGALTRQSAVSPGVSALLRLGANHFSAIAPALEQQVRK